MAVALDAYAISVFLVLCRIGAFLIVVPGLSSARVPGRVRLFFAIALSMVVTPLVAEPGILDRNDGAMLLRLIFAESIAGATIGLVARIYIAALEFMGAAIASYMGLYSMGSAIDHEGPSPAVASLITLLATLLIFVMDLHQLLIATVIETYVTMPIGVMPSHQAGIRLLVDTLAAAFLLALQISGPFVIYGVVVNIMFGLVGKLVPQVPSYFVSVPFLAYGGLLLIYFAIAEMLPIFMRAFRAALVQL